MKLQINNLPKKYTKEKLMLELKEYSIVDAGKLNPINMGKVRGHKKVNYPMWIEFPDEASALEALKELNQKERIINTNRITAEIMDDAVHKEDPALSEHGAGDSPDREIMKSSQEESPAVRKSLETVGEEKKASPPNDDVQFSHAPTHRRPKKIPRPTSGTVFPYYFVPRQRARANASLKESPSAEYAFHRMLNEAHYDVGFEVEWKTLTDTAANPCSDLDPDPNVKDCLKQEGNKKEFCGYGKRWLMTKDKRLGISPFTVKSAIGNGIANILGGCYAVISKKDPHPDKIGDGQYPYNGAWKRYRVPMDNSKPGILTQKAVERDNNGKKEYVLSIQPVEEYYYDVNQDTDSNDRKFEKNKRYYAKISKNKHRNIITPNTIRVADETKISPEVEIQYFGEYRFGMDLGLQPGDLGKRHYHRFYQIVGKPFQAAVKKEHFAPVENLKQLVYMGVFKRLFPKKILEKSTWEKNQYDPRTNKEGDPWYESWFETGPDAKKHLKLKEGTWIYYHQFEDVDPSGIQKSNKINIGQNFQFKALFHHEDTVPEEMQQCNRLDELCPRCKLMGMSIPGDEKKGDVNGLKGRFKSSALISEVRFQETTVKYRLPGDDSQQPVQLKHWTDETNQFKAFQILLPLLASPKPNKRSIGNLNVGYFDKDTGEIKGAKVYEHGAVDLKNLVREIDDLKNNEQYAHRLRTFAMVCPKGIKFNGTLGIENATPEEIAALLMLLEHSLAKHGFKIGLGKALGMGSMISSVKTVWIRKKDDYRWKRIDINSESNSKLNILKKEIPELQAEIEGLQELNDKFNIINSFKGLENRRLEYPPPVKEIQKRNGGTDRITYWKLVEKMGQKKDGFR